jgi:hypothetical protein
LLPAEGGDGSTLSLDFTTGILDPRLSFTRSTNATFINSQGYVEWANSNMYWNTAFEGLSGSNPSLTSSGWGYALSTGGTAVFNGDGTVTVTTTASDRRAIFRSSGFSGGGLRVVASVDVTIASGSLQASQVIVTGTPANAQHYVNGVIWNSSHPIWNGGILPVGTQFNISYATDSQTSGTTSVYFGVGCTSVIAGSATFSNPRWTMWKGSATVPYYPNTSATNNSTTNYFKSNDYQAPRFDYDPTTTPPTPRGLLIEGSASNYMLQSSSLTGYSNSGMATVAAGSDSDPTGTANAALQIYATAGGTYHGFYRIVTAGTNTQITVSIWAKARTYTHLFLSDLSSGRAAVRFNLSTGATDNNFGVGYVSAKATPFPNNWWRCEMVVNVTASTSYGWAFVGVPSSGATLDNYGAQYTGTGNAADGIYCYGFQLEAGSGASSYIPTGASTGNRAADLCTMTGTNFSSWYQSATAGTLYYEFDNPRASLGAATQPAPVNLGDYSAGNLITGFIGGYTTGQLFACAIWGNGGNGFQSATVPTATSVALGNKSAFAFSGQSIMGAFRGISSSTATTTGTVNAKTIMYVGANGTTGTPNRDFFNSCIQRIKFFPTQYTATQLQALTT